MSGFVHIDIDTKRPGIGTYWGWQERTSQFGFIPGRGNLGSSPNISAEQRPITAGIGSIVKVE